MQNDLDFVFGQVQQGQSNSLESIALIAVGALAVSLFRSELRLVIRILAEGIVVISKRISQFRIERGGSTTTIGLSPANDDADASSNKVEDDPPHKVPPKPQIKLKAVPRKSIRKP
jgi:hypothetical protein